MLTIPNKIFLNDIVSDTYTNDGGKTLFIAIKGYFDKGQSFQLSFINISSMSTSFLNSAFADLIHQYGFDFFKSMLKPVDLNKTQKEMLSKYFSVYGYQA